MAASACSAGIIVGQPTTIVTNPVVAKTAATYSSFGHLGPVATNYLQPTTYSHHDIYNHNNGGYVAAAPLLTASKLNVAYSVAPAVSHMTYTNGLGYNYEW